MDSEEQYNQIKLDWLLLLWDFLRVASCGFMIVGILKTSGVV